MKHILLVFAILAASGLLGCSTGTQPQTEDACDRARTVYELYTASLAFRQPSEDEVRAATAAAALLKLQCGWVATRGADSHGVPVIRPPK